MNEIEKLTAENIRLKEENYLKTNWISLLSHDFKEAFISILLLIKAFEDKSISETDFFLLLPQIKKDSEKNLQTITDTGEWIKAQRHNFDSYSEEVFAVELFAHVKKEFHEKLQEKNLQLLFTGEENTKLTTTWRLISFILNKLVHNAIKFSNNGGSINFKVKNTKNHTILSIEDQGTGMSKEQIASIFSFDSPVYKGTEGEIGAGLSLKIVRNFVFLINGTIEIQSIENQGTSVSIILPLTD